MLLHGIDFTSAPRSGKPIVVASGELDGQRLRVRNTETLANFAAFEAFLARPGPWLGGFDTPFGLPREFVESLGWPADWALVAQRAAALSNTELIALSRAFCDARPVGSKFAHRSTDRHAGSSSSMKWVNPPVLLMYRAVAYRLLAAGVSLPALYEGDPRRIALEAYPGQLARSLAGRASYKSDSAMGRTPERRLRRQVIIETLEQNNPLGFAVCVDPAIRTVCLAEPSADTLDAVLCLVQAAWGWQRRDHGYGLPAQVDPLEGWIVATPDQVSDARHNTPILSRTVVPFGS